MSTKSPIFPMPDPLHFTDKGFDLQIDHFQVSEEALHFSKDEHSKKKKKRWWKNALQFFKWNLHTHNHHHNHHHREPDVNGAMARAQPIYLIESRATPYRTTSRRLVDSLSESQEHHHWASTPSMPIYLVT